MIPNTKQLDSILAAKLPIHGEQWLQDRKLPASAVICGSAPSLIEEFAFARRHHPESFVIVVNEAGIAVHGHVLVTQHPEKAKYFLSISSNPGIEAHTGKLTYERSCHPGIAVWWRDCSILATSGGAAIAIALRMGFERIVLCGMPMNGGDGYVRGAGRFDDEKRFGKEHGDGAYIGGYQDALRRFATATPRARAAVRSLSGFTRDLFGAPDWH